MRARVVFRVDASLAIGTGHAMRCLTLADALAGRGATVQFVCREHAGHPATLIRARGHACTLLPMTDSQDDDLAHAAWLGASQVADAQASRAAIGETGCELLVIDHYALDARFERALRPLARRILVIDDLADRDHDCDWLLDQNHHPDPAARYAGRLNPGCRALHGLAYALLRPEFAVDPARAIPARAQRLFVFFGGIDAGGETLKALDALATLPPFAEVDVLIGPDNPHREAIRQRAAAVANAVVTIGATDMADRLRRADLALGAAGATAWERCATALPSIAIVVADNQRPGARAAAADGLYLSLGEAADLTVNDLATAVLLLTANAGLRGFYARRGRQFVDGLGAGRLARLLLPVPLRLRLATLADCEVLHAWRNAPENRRWSHQTGEIPIESHRAWLTRQLAAPEDHLLLVAEDAQGPVGVLRYDRHDDGWRVSVHLVPGRHGKGLGGSVLNAGTDWLRAHRPDIRRVDAEIRAGNTASRKVFEEAGYQPAHATFRLEIAP